MTTTDDFAELSPTTLADVLGADQVMDLGIRPLYGPMARLSGPAFTVSCPPGDNLMLHAAIHRAEPGSVIVVDAGGDLRYALAGGNVCAVAQRRGIAGFVLDGVIRDLAEIRAMGFPVLARGVVPVPGGKAVARPLGEPVVCGGVTVHAGDVLVADEEGVVVTPRRRAAEVLSAARAKVAKEAAQTLDDWQADHRARVEALLAKAGYAE
ncbi:RraA family protein [Streptacidiphilus anmyonensis]|uniref:RraA family protein n=1 Tax=Streptacidiphilus anmyonensis TaxID=405782 RepID=UPI0005AB6F95|nr:RraA family protein [Streptacidiphilus anmyonensis]